MALLSKTSIFRAEMLCLAKTKATSPNIVYQSIACLAKLYYNNYDIGFTLLLKFMCHMALRKVGHRIMPRPSKHVSPDTLGGRIRAARESQHLSLSDVASGHYSTSLISQIERNRVEPSQESLRFLAERLDLPLDELETLAQQSRASESETLPYNSYEELYTEAARHIKNNEEDKALSMLQDLQLSNIPSAQRWRFAALRGQCYFDKRDFLLAIQDLVYALDESPAKDTTLPEQQQELMLLHLHLASCYRELNMEEEATAQFYETLELVNPNTQSKYVAKTHWGLATVLFTKAYRLIGKTGTSEFDRTNLFDDALDHARNAQVLYRSVNDLYNASLVNCLVIQIERALGNKRDVERIANELIKTWKNPPAEYARAAEESTTIAEAHANILAIATATLASLALEAKNFVQAKQHIEESIKIASNSYKVRQAEAQIVYGRILEATQEHEEAEKAFRRAVEILKDTQRLATLIRARTYLASHLLRRGDESKAEAEFAEVQNLMKVVEAQDVRVNEDKGDEQSSQQEMARTLVNADMLRLPALV